MHTPSVYEPVASYDGYCVSCDDESPLVVTEHGPRGVRAWLSGMGPEDRTLSYTCCVCGRVEFVPATEEDDDEYAATLATWPDWTAVQAPRVAAPVVVAAGDVFGLAAARIAAEPRLVSLPTQRVATIRVITLPVQRVAANDEHLLAYSA